MFDFILNMSLDLDVNNLCFGEELMSLIRMKKQQKIKALLNITNVANVEQWTKN